jgi:RNA polymerase sigma-70 factor (ECF subfamily)
MHQEYTEKTDEEIAVLVQNGQTELFGVLMDRYQAKLTRYGKRFLSDPENITDVVQDVFIKTYRNIHSFNTGLKFSSWIYRIAHNEFVNKIKKNILNPLSIIDLDTFLSYTAVDDPLVKEREIAEMRQMIDVGLSQLAPKYREVIILYFLEDLSYQDISDILHVPIGTVGIRLRRGKEALKEIYKKINYTYES